MISKVEWCPLSYETLGYTARECLEIRLAEVGFTYWPAAFSLSYKASSLPNGHISTAIALPIFPGGFVGDVNCRNR